MKALFIILSLFISIAGFTQTETFDLVTYSPPKGWTKDAKPGVVSYITVDKKDTSWCTLSIYKSVLSKGSIEDDFTSEWNELAAKPNNISESPQKEAAKEADGWQIQAGGALYNFNNAKALALLTTFTSNGGSFSILAKTNKKDYLDQVYKLIDNMKFSKPVLSSTQNNTSAQNNTAVATSAPVADGFQFNTTNFDDGWTSTIQPDWVEITKGNIKVLMHYQNAIAKWYNPDRDTEDKQIWDNLISARYSNINSYEHLSNNHSYEIIHFMAADATDKNGKRVFVAMFKQGGLQSTWLEYIFPNRAAFTQYSGIDKYNWDFDGWAPLTKLYNCNKFAVSPKDLAGMWSNDFTGMTQYYNVYTGANAGVKSYQSAQDYNFNSATSYHWKIQVVSGFVGSFQHQKAESDGTFSMPDNWNIHFSDMEGKPKDYPIQFTAIKGGRILWIGGTAFHKK